MKKKILILGASGFLASNFIKKYKQKYQIISSIKSKVKSKNKLFKGTKIINENILDKKITIYSKKIIDCAVYSIALSSKESNESKYLSNKINYEGIKKFCKIIKQNKIKKVIKISTIKVYGNNPNIKVTEKTKANPEDNYATHIFKADQYLKKFCINNDIKYFILRVTNGFGLPLIKSKETDRILLNNFVIQALKNGKIRINSDIDLYKDFTSINNIIDAIDFIISKKNLKEGLYLFSNRFNQKLSQVAKKIKNIYLKELNKEIKILSKFKNKKKNTNFKVSSAKIRNAGFKLINNEIDELKKLILRFKI